ncbi:hypothetical protein [Clostridium sp. C2-6-12]|uniref:hypothetical protein n=1 Tax=Clostridium sp. C2-6-12 TaxID=2698832 RepID=UPI00136A2596|nr:hypothetical protein [Clostridium sp. C2-6-12]
MKDKKVLCKQESKLFLIGRECVDGALFRWNMIIIEAKRPVYIIKDKIKMVVAHNVFDFYQIRSIFYF